MLRTLSYILGAASAIALVAYGLFAAPTVAERPIPTDAEAVTRGEYLINAGGCVSCHEGTEHPETLAGGLALRSEFGTFYAPNITPDAATGVGAWQGEDFLLALKHGRGPDGRFYYPAFPYPSYAGLSDDDVLDIAAYLMSLAPVQSDVPDHEVPGWLQRWTIAGWNLMAGVAEPTAAGTEDAQLNRGAYLARHLGHCGECHTPRNAIGIVDAEREFAGATLLHEDGREGKVEAIDRAALAEWSTDDFVLFLSLGLKPDGEFVGGDMEKVIAHNTSQLNLADKQALAAFFKRDQQTSTD